jgi:competence protein ComEC
MKVTGFRMTVWRAVMMVLCAAGLSIAGPAFAQTVTPSARVATAVIVREGPSTGTSVKGRLRPGESATITSDVSGWYAVTLADGTTGWVSKTWTVAAGEEAPEAALIGNAYKVHVIDVGTGLAIFVEGRDFALLYDAGSQDDLHGGDENRVVAYIKAARPDLTTLDHVILSHPHKDHLELMPDVFARFVVKNVWDSGRVNKTDGYCHFLKAVAAESGVKYHDAVASNTTRTVSFSGNGCNGSIVLHEADMMTAAPVRLGNGAAMTMLYRDAGPHADPNGNSVVVRLDLGPKRILLAGDAEGGERELPSKPPEANSIEAILIQCCAADIRADALVVGHHGSLTSSRGAFLDAVRASTYVISSGPHPYKSVRLPDAEIVSELQTRGQLFRTDVADDSCELSTHKVGPDADETPGGCTNILLTIQANGSLVAGLSPVAD